MTVLDHSFVRGLADDLDRHRAGTFRFRYIADNTVSSPWRLWRVMRNGGSPFLRLTIHYEYGCRAAWQPGIPAQPVVGVLLRLKDDGLYYNQWSRIAHGIAHGWAMNEFGPVVVVLESPADALSPADKNLRIRLDKNLRGIFA